MKIKRFTAATLGGLAALTLAPAAASAAADGTLTCTLARGQAAGFIAYVEVRSGDDVIARSTDRYADDIPDQEQADAGWYGFDLSFTLPAGNHALKLWDVSFGDIDKHGVNPKGSPFGPAQAVKCGTVETTTTVADTTTTEVGTTTTAVPVTSTERPVESSVLDTTTVPATIPTIVVTNPPAVTQPVVTVPPTRPDCQFEEFMLGCFPDVSIPDIPVPQPSTTAAPVNTLPATGGNHTPAIALGTIFVLLGMIAWLASRRPGNSWS